MSGKDIRVLLEQLSTITEMPKLHDEELALISTQPSISKSALTRSYELIGNLGSSQSHIAVYKKKNNLGFIAGVHDDGSFTYFLDIKTRHHSYPVEPSNLMIPNFQVSFVNVSEDYAEQTYTKSVYKFLISKYDVISDHEQYIGGKRLWQSISSETDVFIYVFDGNIDDYIRDNDDQIVRYQDESISEKNIWGHSIDFSKILLIASRNSKK
jgi:hypothetical protein